MMNKVIKDISLKLIFNIFEKLHDLPNDFSFLSEKMKIEKVRKLVANLHDKTEYVIHIKKLTQALHHGLVLKKLDRIIKFKQKA